MLMFFKAQNMKSFGRSFPPPFPPPPVEHISKIVGTCGHLAGNCLFLSSVHDEMLDTSQTTSQWHCLICYQLLGNKTVLLPHGWLPIDPAQHAFQSTNPRRRTWRDRRVCRSAQAQGRFVARVPPTPKTLVPRAASPLPSCQKYQNDKSCVRSGGSQQGSSTTHNPGHFTGRRMGQRVLLNARRSHCHQTFAFKADDMLLVCPGMHDTSTSDEALLRVSRGNTELNQMISNADFTMGGVAECRSNLSTAKGYTGRYIGRPVRRCRFGSAASTGGVQGPLDHEYICVAVKRPGAVMAWGRKTAVSDIAVRDQRLPVFTWQKAVKRPGGGARSNSDTLASFWARVVVPLRRGNGVQVAPEPGERKTAVSDIAVRDQRLPV